MGKPNNNMEGYDSQEEWEIVSQTTDCSWQEILETEESEPPAAEDAEDAEHISDDTQVLLGHPSGNKRRLFCVRRVKRGLWEAKLSRQYTGGASIHLGLSSSAEEASALVNEAIADVAQYGVSKVIQLAGRGEYGLPNHLVSHTQTILEPSEVNRAPSKQFRSERDKVTR